jgi:hypothetical protein
MSARKSERLSSKEPVQYYTEDEELDEKTGKLVTPKLKYDTLPFAEAYRWIIWCYKIVNELAPPLIQNEEFHKLYHEMLNICKKYENRLKHGKIDDKYNSTYLRLLPEDLSPPSQGTYKSYWRGYRGYFENEFYSLPADKLESNRVARNEILDVYIKIYELISPHILGSMNLMYNYKELNLQIRGVKQSITNTTARIQRLENEIESNKRYKLEKMKELEELEKALASTPKPHKYK